jgi:hypothetical protein
MILCNRCALKSCSSYNSLTVAKNRNMFIAPERFKTPLLVHLMQGRKATNTAKVLNHFGFMIEETGKYPFFKLHLKGRR